MVKKLIINPEKVSEISGLESDFSLEILDPKGKVKSTDQKVGFLVKAIAAYFQAANSLKNSNQNTTDFNNALTNLESAYAQTGLKVRYISKTI